MLTASAIGIDSKYLPIDYGCVEQTVASRQRGEPTPQTFVNEESQASSRLFGHGAKLRVKRLSVESAPDSS